MCEKCRLFRCQPVNAYLPGNALLGRLRLNADGKAEPSEQWVPRPEPGNQTNHSGYGGQTMIFRPLPTAHFRLRRLTAQHAMVNKCTKKTPGRQPVELAILRQRGMPSRGPAAGRHAFSCDHGAVGQAVKRIDQYTAELRQTIKRPEKKLLTTYCRPAPRFPPRFPRTCP